MSSIGLSWVGNWNPAERSTSIRGEHTASRRRLIGGVRVGAALTRPVFYTLGSGVEVYIFLFAYDWFFLVLGVTLVEPSCGAS